MMALKSHDHERQIWRQICCIILKAAYFKVSQKFCKNSRELSNRANNKDTLKTLSNINYGEFRENS